LLLAAFEDARCFASRPEGSKQAKERDGRQLLLPLVVTGSTPGGSELQLPAAPGSVVTTSKRQLEGQQRGQSKGEEEDRRRERERVLTLAIDREEEGGAATLIRLQSLVSLSAQTTLTTRHTPPALLAQQWEFE